MREREGSSGGKEKIGFVTKYVIIMGREDPAKFVAVSEKGGPKPIDI